MCGTYTIPPATGFTASAANRRPARLTAPANGPPYPPRPCRPSRTALWTSLPPGWATAPAEQHLLQQALLGESKRIAVAALAIAARAVKSPEDFSSRYGA